MKTTKMLRRFLTPPLVVTLIGFIRYRCKISPRAEVELSPFLKIGTGTEISSFVKIKSADGQLVIGNNVAIGTGCFISSGKGALEIGDDCMIGPNVAIVGNRYDYTRLDVPLRLQGTRSNGIRINRNVWIGSGCAILDGAVIGSGSIIAANSAVSQKIPENSVFQGNPGKVIFVRR